ncbi:hypothetical protein I5189_04149 [Pseudomonas aeruginosa]|nr:hypothetical protein [Pseudomonas aeruginosa]GLF34639.1 hypothetical protein VNPA141581_34010 [Pseudomonas aeruginosa]
MSIRDWPEAERPREKLLEQGAAALSDAELLAIFLRTGVTGCSAVELSRRLLSEFGGLRALLEADLASFCGHLGLGVAKYAQLQAVLEMGRRHLAERLRRDSILESPQAVRDYLKARLRHEQHEVFACLFLDTRHRVLAFEVLFQGSIDGASVYPRQVVKRCNYWINRFDRGGQRCGDLLPVALGAIQGIKSRRAVARHRLVVATLKRA